MVEVDLHLHTKHSDGTLTPTQLVRLCADRGLRIISISDHDSTQGIVEALRAAQSFPQLTVIPGIELSTEVPGSEVHVLGYFVDYDDTDFQSTLRGFRESRQNRVSHMVESLRALGVEISWERVKEISGGGSIGRPHIAQAMVEAGYVQYPSQAFDQYLGRTGPAYVERSKLTPTEAIRILVENGAVPVMAHPTYSVPQLDSVGRELGKDEVSALRRILQDLKKAGLVGMEVYYRDYPPEWVRCLEGLAGELGLVPCGGSDYHASGNPGEPEPGSVGPPIDSVEALKAFTRHVPANSRQSQQGPRKP